MLLESSSYTLEERLIQLAPIGIGKEKKKVVGEDRRTPKAKAGREMAHKDQDWL